MTFHVYWEKQDPQTRLCALHCLNSLLQGPKVTAGELSEISHMLDYQERALLGGNAPLQASALGYRNVSEGGFFNVTVLQEALLRRGLRCDYAFKSDLRLELFQRESNIGYIYNVKEHWFCARRLRGRWYMLDSMRNGPVEMEPGQAYDTCTRVLEKQLGIVFRVASINGGPLPEAEPQAYPIVDGQYQFFLSDAEIQKLQGGDFEQEDEHQQKSFLYKAGDLGLVKPSATAGAGGGTGGNFKSGGATSFCTYGDNSNGKIGTLGGANSNKSSPKPSVWPSSGGKRLDQGYNSNIDALNSISTSTNASSAANSQRLDVTIAVKTPGGSRVIRSFAKDDDVVKVFEWLESEGSLGNLKENYVYSLVQAHSQRRLIRYCNNCIEVQVADEGPKDISEAKIGSLDLASQELFMLAI